MDNFSVVDKAVRVFKSGGIVIFPTDTVWGIGVSIKRIDALKKLYQIKKREPSKPTAVLVGSFYQAQFLGYINKNAKTIIKKYWPGGLTIVVKANKTVPSIIRGKDNTVGLRMPNQDLILKILNKLNCGIVAPSANFSGYPPPSEYRNIDYRLKQLADYVVDSGFGSGLASTVVDTTQEKLRIIRQGSLSLKKLL